MLLLAARLRRAGVVPGLFGYVPAVESFEAIAGRLAGRLAGLARDPDYFVVGHSLGGLLLRSALSRLDPGVPRPRHLFMLATPNQSPRLARRFQRNALYRWYNGDAGQLLASPGRMGSIPGPEVPYTLITGTSGRTGRWSPFGDEPNDWVVSLSEARVTDSDEVVTVPANHTFLMNHREVAAVIVGQIGGWADGPRGGPSGMT